MPERDRLGDRYLLLDKLGSGGMATVYRAWDERLEVFRAVKILGTALAQKGRVRQRLEREARLMAQLRHPNIVTLHELAEDGHRLYLVMELLIGGSLMERVTRDGPLPPRMAVQVVEGVLAALALAHEQGVVHRDVKPHNVILDGDGTPKVTDFGIARLDVANEMTRTGAVLGTLAYMPPEQKLSARKVDARSDLYATGGTLFCLLTGREPFDLYVAGMDEALASDFFAGVPPALVPVIRRATAFRMEDRYPTAAAMADALRAAAATLPADPPGPPLVDPDEVAKARATASMGPTLVGEPSVTVDTDPPPAEETTPFARIVAPTPPSEPSHDPTPPAAPLARPAVEPRRRGASVLGLGLVLALAILGLGGAGGLGLLVALLYAQPPVPVALPTPAPMPVPVPVPVPVAVPAPVPAPHPVAAPAPAPIAVIAAPPPPHDHDHDHDHDHEGVTNPPPGPAPVHEEPPPPPAPTPITLVPVPPPEVVEIVEVPPPAPPPSKGGWKIDLVGTGRLEPDVYAVLPAEADVADRNGKPGRPQLVVACVRGKLRVSVRTGVSSVEAIFSETGLALTQASVRYADAAGAEDTKMTFDPGLPSELQFPKPYDRWVERIAATESVSLTYSPFSSGPVTARFTSADAAPMVAAMTEHCGLR